MIKDINHITIRDYNLFEKTGNPRSLISGLFWKKKNLESRLLEIAQNLGSEKDKDQVLKKEHHRLSSLFRIEYLIVLYESTYNLLVNKTQIDVWKSAIGKNKGSDFTNLIDYVAKIEEQTGIVIDPDNWQTGMIGLKWEIDRWTDKYAENFTNQSKEDGVTFMQIVLGVFSVLKFPINEEICLSDFFEMKRQAEKIVIQMKAHQDAR